MAKKDTLKALTSRDISEEVAVLLLTKYSTLSAISAASIEELVALGISEAEAEATQSKIGKRTTRTAAAPVKTKKPVPEPKNEVMEEVYREYVFSVTENRLNAIIKKLGIFLPMKIVTDISSAIEAADLSDEICEKLIVTANRMYTSHLMDKNESTGVMAAHSLGEPGTQMNMRTFHYAGVANINVTQGLPRLIEIVDARRVPSTPSMDIPLTGMAAEDEGVARHVASEIEVTSLLDIASVETDITNMRLVVTPNTRKMEQRGLEAEDIVDRLNKIKQVRGMVKLSGYQIVITSDEPSYKKLQAMYDAVKTAKIKGIDGISRAVLSRVGGSWKIITEGSNLKEVLKIEGVNANKVMTNSILEVADVLGIEAARNSIIREAMGTLGEAGLDVDIRHIMLVADLMTNDGQVKAIGRHGVSGKKSSVLARAAFEITAAHLLHAAMVGEVDSLEGVTENIIVGQPVTLGTGAVNLIYTPKKGENE
ncbi:DNA-directed RNA polymerase subunit A'' [Candidatus Methanoplasma termitum]|uniref:DNA-directed RNA polymerase subunit Rpo1C n=1 Tax=Candidatus Methanoplasma termitum TaxID=1577791 RepID=A0A0A7LE34_9ARCH|nr:DNA-directed RNA polymerase subunit A'' [Candidatus Methanoplasma termitum]AIZ57248.1 DNA-directed RNA polymerase subunit A'' [Candidatus Methanoplasma termitum]